jgi:hypothetical protein
MRIITLTLLQKSTLLPSPANTQTAVLLLLLLHIVHALDRNTMVPPQCKCNDQHDAASSSRGAVHVKYQQPLLVLPAPSTQLLWNVAVT